MNITLRDNRGFTLIEIMVVVVILALLAALVGPKIMGRSDEAKIADTKVQIRNLESALKFYKLDNGVYPTTEQGLQALVEKPTVGADPEKLPGRRVPGEQEAPQGPLEERLCLSSRPVNTVITTSAPTAPTAPRGAKGIMRTSAAGT